MTYTILSANYANEDNTAVVIFTKEAAAVAISKADTPKEWQNMLEWAKTNEVKPFPVEPKNGMV